MTNDRVATIAVATSFALVAAVTVAFAASGGPTLAPRSEDLLEIATTRSLAGGGTSADLWKHHDTSSAPASVATSPTADAIVPDDGENADAVSSEATKVTGAGVTKDKPGLALGMTREHVVVTPPGLDSDDHGKSSDPSLRKDPTPHTPGPSDEKPNGPADD